MAPKRKYTQSKKQTQYEKAEFNTVRTINFYTEGDKSYQAALTFRDDEPLVGLQKLWFGNKTNEWKHSKKGVFMNVEAWYEFLNRVEEIKATFEPLFDNPPSGKKAARPMAPEVGGSSSTATTSN